MMGAAPTLASSRVAGTRPAWLRLPNLRRSSAFSSPTAAMTSISPISSMSPSLDHFPSKVAPGKVARARAQNCTSGLCRISPREPIGEQGVGRPTAGMAPKHGCGLHGLTATLFEVAPKEPPAPPGPGAFLCPASRAIISSDRHNRKLSEADFRAPWPTRRAPGRLRDRGLLE